MNKYKFAVPRRSGIQLEELLSVIRKLPSNAKITNSVENLIHSAVRDNPMEETVYIFFDPNRCWAEDVLEYCFNRHYFFFDEETVGYELVKNVQAFISANGVLAETVAGDVDTRFNNAIFNVNGEYESRAVLLRLKEIGKITEEEYQSCFPPGDEKRYLFHKTIFLANGVVSFDIRKLTHNLDNELPEPHIFDMGEFLDECPARPHAHLMREWLDDPTLQIEMQVDGGDWTIVRNPSWMEGRKYRRYVEAKSPVEMKIEDILAKLTTDERNELKRQLGVS